MAINTVQVREFECERCGWKWVSRINGKDIEGLPSGCAKCKTYLWNTPRERIMLRGAYWQARRSNKEFVRRRFLDLYNTQKDIALLSQKERDKFSELAYDITLELAENH